MRQLLGMTKYKGLREKIRKTEAKEIRGEDILQLLFIFPDQRQLYM